jgi:hypothetical protein
MKLEYTARSHLSFTENESCRTFIEDTNDFLKKEKFTDQCSGLQGSAEESRPSPTRIWGNVKPGIVYLCHA